MERREVLAGPLPGRALLELELDRADGSRSRGAPQVQARPGAQLRAPRAAAACPQSFSPTTAVMSGSSSSEAERIPLYPSIRRDASFIDRS